tara:strand:- start:497 stop:913 length:417 start_codon:yes stop_codon:yes gene_type:complete
MASASSWALPAAVIGAIYLLKEIKTIKIPFPTIPDIVIQPGGVEDLLTERTEALQTYEAERIADATRIEAERASTQLAVGNYGTVDGSLGAFTGTWFPTAGKPGDSCHVVRAGAQSSAGWKMFTGSYCRSARAQGLIQ